MEGDRILVVPCGLAFGHGYRTSVSHVRVYRNPWDEVAAWNDRDVKCFTIESVTKTHAWGTINSGVRTRVPLDGLETLLPENAWHGHQIPLPGDEIAGWFLHANVDDKEQIVTLDLANYVKSNVVIHDVLDTAATRQTPISVPEHQDDTGSDLSSLVAQLRIKTLLLLDDDPGFRDSLSQYLQNTCGITVLPCEDDNSARAAIDEQGPEIDVAIIDVNLNTEMRGKKDHDGIQVARYLRDRFPKCPLVLTTGEEINLEHPCVTEEPILTVQDIVYKPFGTDSLHRALSCVGKPPRPLSDLRTVSQLVTFSHRTAHN